MDLSEIQCNFFVARLTIKRIDLFKIVCKWLWCLGLTWILHAPFSTRLQVKGCVVEPSLVYTCAVFDPSGYFVILQAVTMKSIKVIQTAMMMAIQLRVANLCRRNVWRLPLKPRPWQNIWQDRQRLIRASPETTQWQFQKYRTWWLVSKQMVWIVLSQVLYFWWLNKRYK